MSIIFQTLGKLNTAETGHMNMPESDDGQHAPLHNQRTQSSPFRRSLWILGIVVLALVLVGFGAVLGIHYLAATAIMDPVEPAAGPASAMSTNEANSIDTKKATGQAQVEQAAPRYISSQPLMAESVSRNNDMVSPERFSVAQRSDSARLPEMNSAVADPSDRTESGNASVSLPVDQADTIVQETGTTSIQDEMSKSNTQQDMSPALKTRMQKPPADELTYERRQAQKAQRIAREKSERINNLVLQLETALSQWPGNDVRIESLLQKLTREKGRHSVYVAKMKAFWLLKQKRYGDAEIILKKLASSDDADPEVGINLAIIDLHSGDRQSALKRLQLLRKSHPDNTYIADLYRKLK